MNHNGNAMALAKTRQPFGNVVVYPGRAGTDPSMTRPKTELNIWQMAAALQIDLVAAIRTSALSRDKPLDLLQSMARRCGACEQAEACSRRLCSDMGRRQSPPEFCAIKSCLTDLAAQHAPARHMAS
ncbi:MAG: hypothetical protein HLUCCA05_03625 [Roseibaca calidilacus]|uniref:DUF6455 domain-containing protein n=1 Tax=Roseibaca calidilacus TaxID=1666912 RepID=A0A0P7W751_9RHOB|nr:DUF6455 family protein [Roseibaca calidilacus]KPP95768.1 MAG: hypothetical protein HLUCCA05_03625 [Roseibaca calidilacus]CUX81740.1 hypothetical protein Ga0058931_1949 [Roseibaca calidilacus]